MDNETLRRILLVAPVLLFSVIAHEIAHGYAALTQGDPTARQQGRLSWNPLRHIDPYMTVILPVMLLILSRGSLALGGAKPVPVDPRNYRHFKRGDIIVSLAGVATNLLIALLSAALIAVIGKLGQNSQGGAAAVLQTLQAMLVYGVVVNLGLIAFNLIPLPPLDGSHVAKYLMPVSWAIRYQTFGRRYGILALILLLAVGSRFLDLWMRPASALGGALLQAVSPFFIRSA